MSHGQLTQTGLPSRETNICGIFIGSFIEKRLRTVLSYVQSRVLSYHSKDSREQTFMVSLPAVLWKVESARDSCCHSMASAETNIYGIFTDRK